MQNTDFEAMKQKIYRYSLKVSGDKWEAEDLSQDVLMKLVNSLKTDPARDVTNAYLYRIVQTTWMDKCKKAKRQTLFGHTLEDHGGDDAQLATRELLEVLAHRLSPRAMVILLLMDVFDLTAKESAHFLSSTEGAVQVALGRARARLKKIARDAADDRMTGNHRETVFGVESGSTPHFDALVDAFRKRDLKALCRTYLGLAGQGMDIRNIQVKEGKYCFYFKDPDGNLFMVTST